MLCKNISHYHQIGAKRRFVVLASCLIMLMLCGSAFGGPLLWRLDGVAFEDGGTGVGSFIYDAEVNLYQIIS